MAARLTFTIDHDDLWPRDAEHRYRIYAIRGAGRSATDREVLCATATPEGIGAALVQLHEDEKAAGRRLADRGRIGVLDVLGGEGAAGDWIVLPWDRRFE